MLKFHNNYNFCYIPDTKKIYTICKKPSKRQQKNIVLNPLRYEFFTAPYYNRINGVGENVLVGFITHTKCTEHIKYINDDVSNKIEGYQSVTQLNDHSREMWMDLPPLDNTSTSQSDDIMIGEFTLNEGKVISDVLKMPLMVVTSEKNGHYELFFYRQPIT